MSTQKQCFFVMSAAAMACVSLARAGDPTDLLLGEAPVLFTAAEGADPGDETLLDGQTVVGDDIWLWAPALDGLGMVDLGATGQFFKIWDSGNAVDNPADFNDDPANGMRGMDFDQSTGTFLISYEDTTTTGFAFGNILDGDLMRVTPDTVTNGLITQFTLTRLYNECANGTAGCLGTEDINSLCLLGDSTFFFGSGGSQNIVTDVPGVVSAGSSSLLHVDGITGSSPVNLGPNVFFEASAANCPVIFCPSIFVGQLRGADILDDGTVTFGTSGDWKNTEFSGPIDGLSDAQAEALATGVESTPTGQKGDILYLPDYNNGALNTYQRRTASVLYAGSLFFPTPHTGDAEILDHDIIDTQAELAALIAAVGAKSPAGIALSAHAPDAGCPGECVAPLGTIDVFDLLELLANWGTGNCGAAFAAPDNIVDVFDLLELLSLWGVCP